jgi:hypothetical protein
MGARAQGVAGGTSVIPLEGCANAPGRGFGEGIRRAGTSVSSSGGISSRIAGGAPSPPVVRHLNRRMWTFRRSPTAIQFTIIEVPP